MFMISRTEAQLRVHALERARKKLVQWMRADDRARRDPAFDESKPGGEVERLRGELVEMGADVRVALTDAEVPAVIEILPGDGYAVLTERSLNYPTYGPAVLEILDQAGSFYERIAHSEKRSPVDVGTTGDQTKRLEEKDAQRLRLLNAIYALTNGDSRKRTSHVEAHECAGLDAEDGEAAAHYLGQARLIHGSRALVGLTHAGVEERERALRNGGARTDHFSAAAVQNVFHIHAPVGVLQTGHSSVARDSVQG